MPRETHLPARLLPRCESHRNCVRLTRLTRASIRFDSLARSIDLTCLSASQQGQRDESIILAARRGGVERLTLSTLSRSSSFRSRSASSSFCSCVTAAATPQDADMERTVSGIGNMAAAGSVARATGAASATVVQPTASTAKQSSAMPCTSTQRGRGKSDSSAVRSATRVQPSRGVLGAWEAN
eukprot:COSAG06_NODE_246_length_19169_cov_28.627950_5_plen_183_part_00